MPLTRELRNDAYKLYLLIGERDMPSNNTAERLKQRSGLPAARVLAALDLLWCDDAGFIRVDTNPDTGERGYFVDPKCKKKSPPDLDDLYLDWEQVQDEAWEEEDDDEWDEMDEEDEGD